MHGIGQPIPWEPKGLQEEGIEKARADPRPSLALHTTMAITEVRLDIELAIEIYQTLQHHPGAVPAHIWELRAKIDDAAHAILGPLSQTYTDEIMEVLAKNHIDQAQDYLDHGASDSEVVATWWLLYRGHLHADQA